MGNRIDYYFMAGNNMDGVIANYRELTGKAQVMPKWAMGFWQSRERYKTQDELLGTLTEFRKRRIPIDNIVQDWFYWEVDQWGSHEFDPERFPDPKGMVDKVHEQHAHIMISVFFLL
jgi:alpha-D-xyloside xylohydrolase